MTLQGSQLRTDMPGRHMYLYGPGYVVKVEFYAGHHWCAVELDEGGFRRRLYDGRE